MKLLYPEAFMSTEHQLVVDTLAKRNRHYQIRVSNEGSVVLDFGPRKGRLTPWPVELSFTPIRENVGPENTTFTSGGNLCHVKRPWKAIWLLRGTHLARVILMCIRFITKRSEYR